MTPTTCQTHHRRRFQFGLRALFFVVIGTGLVSAVVSRPLRENRDIRLCQSHLHQLAVAMHQYNDLHGTLPPAYLVDAGGNPAHSWRVLLLPFLGPEAKRLYQQYDFSQAWNGPNNRTLARQMPSVFTCPRDNGRGEATTSYVLVTGEGTVFNGSQSMSLDYLASNDGVTGTLLLIETTDSGVHWMEPRDLHYDRMTLTINDRSARTGVGSRHRGGANVSMADAAARFVSESVDPDAWKRCFTADAGDVVHGPY